MFKMLRRYRLFILLILAATALSVSLVVIKSAAGANEQVLRDIHRRTAELRLAKIDEGIQYLNILSEKYDLKVFEKPMAKSWIIDSAQEFITNLDGSIIGGIQDTGSAITTNVRFAYTPDRPENFINMLNFLSGSTRPIIKILRINYTGTEDDHRFVFAVELTQPYMSGADK